MNTFSNFEIITSSKENWTPEELYNMIISRNIDSFKNHIDETFKVFGWIIYRDLKSGQDLVAVDSDIGVLSGNSQTIMEDLKDIWDIFDEGVEVTIKSKVSKNGRNFCDLVH